MESSSPGGSLVVHDWEPDRAQFLADVWRGLAARPKRLPSKYFYDQRGSRLFDRICELDEYYLTRCELAIMQQWAGEMAEAAGPECTLIEYGSGSSIKTRQLLDKLERPAAYVPVDISREHLQHTARQLEERYPRLLVQPVCADFTQPFEVPVTGGAGRRVLYFPGSTIGNFEPPATRRLLAQIRDEVGPGGALLLGIDLQKDVRVLEAAYNDRQQVTAAFNVNLLRRINRELEGNFAVDQFQHRAVYHAEAERIEMHLVSITAQTAQVAGRRFRFQAGETICTEYSHKYHLGRFRTLAADAGLPVRCSWTDPRHYFAVLLAESAKGNAPGEGATP